MGDMGFLGTTSSLKITGDTILGNLSRCPEYNMSLIQDIKKIECRKGMLEKDMKPTDLPGECRS
jgi:hypothetical protein